MLNSRGRPALGATAKARLQADIRQEALGYAQALLNGPYIGGPSTAHQNLDRLHQKAKILNDYNTLEFQLEEMAEEILDTLPPKKARYPLANRILDRIGAAEYDNVLAAIRAFANGIQDGSYAVVQSQATIILDKARNLKEVDALIFAALTGSYPVDEVRAVIRTIREQRFQVPANASQEA